MGSTRYLNLVPKIQNLFGGRLLVFCCDWRFFLNHSRSICGFFRSIDLRNTGPIVPLIHFRILRSSLAFGIQEIILLWKKWFRDSAAGPILPDLAGFFNYHDGPALLSFLVAALPAILSRLPRVSRPWFVFLGVSIIYHTKTPVYIDKVDILMMHYLYNCCIERIRGLVL